MLIFLSLPGIGFLNLIWLRVFAFLKARTLLRILSNTFSLFLTELRGTLALHSSTAALLSLLLRFFLTCSFPLYCLESSTDLLLDKRLPNEKILSYNGEIPSKTAIYNPFSGTLYFRAVSISGRQIFNFSDRPRLLAGTVLFCD
jgi:hypothetical protein